MAITKTDFMRGMQCPKMLWLDKHRPGLKVIPPEIQAKLDAGNEFGDLAMSMFGPYEEMTVYLPGTTIPDKKAMLQRTQEQLYSVRQPFQTTTTTALLISSGRRKRVTISMRLRMRRKFIPSL